MAPTKISFNDHCATPPVYVAGSFTDWQVVEIDPVEKDSGFYYEKTFDLAPGTHQYKFRLGPGDWWACDSQAPKSIDAAGNENNEIVIKPEPVQSSPAVAAAPAVASDHKSDSANVAKVAEPVRAVEPVKVAEPVKAVEPPKVVAAAPTPALAPVSEPAKLPENGSAVKTYGVHHSVTEDAKSTEAPAPFKPAEKASATIPEPVAPVKQDPVVQAPKATEEVIATPTAEKPMASPTTEKPVAPPTIEKTVAPLAEKPVVTPVTEKTQQAANTGSAGKESLSKDSSLSSVPAKKTPTEKQSQPEKLSWFRRCFLCGSSAK